MYIIYRVCIKYRETFHIMNIGQNIDRDTKIVVSLSPSVCVCVCVGMYACATCLGTHTCVVAQNCTIIVYCIMRLRAIF